MHIGSLAFVIEGQVKEKSKWFTSLRDLMRGLKIMKMEHMKLLDEVEEYKKYEAVISEMGLIIKSKSKVKIAHDQFMVQFFEITFELDYGIALGYINLF